MDLKPIVTTTINNIKNIDNAKQVIEAVNTVVKTLEKENRVEIVPSFISQFNDALQNIQQETIVVFTPVTLTETNIEKLTSKVKDLFKIDSKEIKVEQIIDETIIGGMIIKYKDEEIDLTTNKKIKVIKKSI
jgi:F-type H+-transporting ATPase subunit delta